VKDGDGSGQGQISETDLLFAVFKICVHHIPKCAGSSIHRALGVLHTQRSLPVGKPKYHKHAKAATVREVLGPAWNECFKFAFIRNPWDLMLSSYHWWLTYAEIFPALHKDVARIREMGSFLSSFAQNSVVPCLTNTTDAI